MNKKLIMYEQSFIFYIKFFYHPIKTSIKADAMSYLGPYFVVIIIAFMPFMITTILLLYTRISLLASAILTVAVVAEPVTAPIGFLNSAVKVSPGSFMLSERIGTATVMVLESPTLKVKVRVTAV